MSPTAAVQRRDTAMDSSDVAELLIQHNLIQNAWVLNIATMAVNTTQFSGIEFFVAEEGTMRVVTAFSTGGGFTGITAVTANVVVCVGYILSSGTHVVAAGAEAGSFGVAALPVVPASGVAYGMILIKACGTSAFTGGTTVLDGTNASAAFFNLIGPTAIALATSPITLVPG